MSTRISSLALLGVLAGCATSLPAPDRAALRVGGATVAVQAPAGYCIDRSSLDVGRGGGFALMIDCAVLGAAPVTAPPAPGVITVSVSTGGTPEDFAALEALIDGPGVVVFGRSGDRDAIRVLERRRVGDALYLKIEDTGTQPIPGVAPRFWRVFFPAGPRMATGAASGFADAPLSDAESLRLLGELVARTRAANAAAAPA